MRLVAAYRVQGLTEDNAELQQRLADQEAAVSHQSPAAPQPPAAPSAASSDDSTEALMTSGIHETTSSTAGDIAPALGAPADAAGEAGAQSCQLDRAGKDDSITSPLRPAAAAAVADGADAEELQAQLDQTKLVQQEQSDRLERLQRINRSAADQTAQLLARLNDAEAAQHAADGAQAELQVSTTARTVILPVWLSF